MSLSAADLLGLPAPDVMRHVAALRWTLAALALLWAGALLARRRWLPLLAGVLFVEAAVGFWVLALGRPYGLLVDPEATRRAAVVSLAAEGARPEQQGPLAASGPVSDALAAWARAPGWTSSLLLPTLLPLAAPAFLGLAIALAWGRREHAGLAAGLWLAFGTGELDAVDGAGFVSGIWAHPLACLAVMGGVPLLLGLCRLLRRPGAAWPAALAVAGGLWLVPAPQPGPGLAVALLWLVPDQGLWLPLGLVGLVRSRDAAPRALALGGALAVLASGCGVSLDAWGGHAAYRVGLLLAASQPIAGLAEQVGGALSGHPRLAGRGLSPAALGLALLFAAAVPGSFLAWWDPPKLDPVAKASLAPLSPNLLAPMAWIRRETPPGAVFMADEDYSAAIAALAGRRVLRAPLLGRPADDERRVRTERVTLSGRDPGPLRTRYGVSHVLVAPGDFRVHGLRAPEDLEGRGRFRRLYSDAEGLRVYEIE